MTWLQKHKERTKFTHVDEFSHAQCKIIKTVAVIKSEVNVVSPSQEMNVLGSNSFEKQRGE